MNEDFPKNTTGLIHHISTLAGALNINDCSPDLQQKIVGEWSELLLNRLLLRISPEHTEAAKEAIAKAEADGKDSGELLEDLAEYIPDFDNTLEEEIASALKKFQLPSAE